MDQICGCLSEKLTVKFVKVKLKTSELWSIKLLSFSANSIKTDTGLETNWCQVENYYEHEPIKQWAGTERTRTHVDGPLLL